MKNNLLNKLSPYERMAKMYEENPREHPFSWYVVWHQINGFCFATPDFFIMGREIKVWPELFDSITQYGISNFVKLHRDEANGWFIHAMAGDMSKAWSILPYELPFIAFYRLREKRFDLQVLPLSRIRRITRSNVS